MSDDNAQHSDKENKKGFFSILLSQIFHDEPKNKEELLTLIKYSEENELIDRETGHMLEGVIHITKQKIRDIMIPRPQMITLKLTYSLEQCLDVITKSLHSRFPVMSENENYVEGFLITKDLLPFIKNNTEMFCIKKILRPAIVVPESKHVNHMLKEFRLTKNHMAIVIDEFGVVSGLVTIEDILELIVGNIEDEYDETKKNICQLNQSTFIIKSLTSIKEFNETFNTNFNDEEVDTIGGLVMKKIGHLPIRGEYININQYKFKIHIANNRRIILLQVTIPKK
ncbi:magnesium and cobalt efflux protein CorC [Buchnera aphidicola str. Bp (Baizongia pistaciae)]|uniref:Magnesium and cobalt efflux protein CorC n=1 Tax=Buchnera aphidicola subsp. Baizongia pistaciae (strain Bp) TaxID=224915 RepID=CORC_BUCBP|nr:CNNM family magnesium/cobalt transport protein CorC [Buchnera aphidicola]Q89AC1.1 RecName: Full=Magnesium and cobalt efflux protein CorC [Buchnera aphidicola str. Bp (Baizongia pistaciae)]AAO27106.1 magnesium and cobalt efflux protein CorC [Buchnera aphidicola str. Bp (Baizongia pistaciae)]